MQRAIALGTPGTPGLVLSSAHQSMSPAPLCFVPKQVVGIIVDSSALREGPPLDVNQGQGEERGEERRTDERKKRDRKGWNKMDGVQRMAYPSVGSTEEGWLAG